MHSASSSQQDLGFNIKPCINYCCPKVQLGFRGIHRASQTARLIPIPPRNVPVEEEMFLFFGVDVSISALPYIPDMGPGSDFQRRGHWHYYGRHQLLQALHWKGEERPRIIMDFRRTWYKETIITKDELETVASIIRSKGIHGVVPMPALN